MKAVALKMKRYVESVSIVNNNDLAQKALRFMLVSLGLLALVYVVLLANMVYSIIARRALDTQARALSSEVSEMELSYLSLSNKVDLAYSHGLGFKEIKPTFARRKALGSVKVARNEL